MAKKQISMKVDEALHTRSKIFIEKSKPVIKDFTHLVEVAVAEYLDKNGAKK
jgi:hypothetical protein